MTIRGKWEHVKRLGPEIQAQLEDLTAHKTQFHQGHYNAQCYTCRCLNDAIRASFQKKHGRMAI